MRGPVELWNRLCDRVRRDATATSAVVLTLTLALGIGANCALFAELRATDRRGDDVDHSGAPFRAHRSDDGIAPLALRWAMGDGRWAMTYVPLRLGAIAAESRRLEFSAVWNSAPFGIQRRLEFSAFSALLCVLRASAPLRLCASAAKL